MPYAVPDGYFEELPGEISASISGLEAEEVAPVWGKEVPFAVPTGYFDELTSHITAATRLSESTRDVPFSVPGGYFEALPAKMLHAAKASGADKKPARLIPLKRTSIFRQVRWAAAAVMLISIGVGYQVFFGHPSGPEKILASVPGNDLQEYIEHTYRLDVKNIEGATEINNIPLENRDIIQYLDETGWDIID